MVLEKLSMSSRLQHGWNAFKNKDPADLSMFTNEPFMSSSSPSRQDRPRAQYQIDPTMINSIFTRMTIDAISSAFEHIKTDENGGYLSTVNSGLNEILNVEANIDQSGFDFRLDLVSELLNEGCVVCVPIDTKNNPIFGINAMDIETMRVGVPKNWWPDRVAVEIYNDKTGRRETINVFKKSVAIITNPFYSIMNEPNSTLKRLNKRLSLLDIADNRVSSNKLDMLVQLPYSVKSKMREDMAAKRRNEIVTQLEDSEYGIAYVDGTEKIIQLNRPLENNLIANIEYLTNLLFSQLGLSPEILNMTANEQSTLNYYRRMIDPINDAIANEFRRKFLTKTARSQNQTIWYHSEPFKFTPTSMLAELSDKLIRNEVVTSNEMRGVIGYKPSDDPRANVLANPNMPQTQIPTKTDTNEGVGSWNVGDLSE